MTLFAQPELAEIDTLRRSESTAWPTTRSGAGVGGPIDARAGAAAATRARRRWLCALGALGIWSFADATIGRGSILNAAGWSQVRDFVVAAPQPELSRDFLDVVARSAATTAGYSLVGTALAMTIGVVLGVLSSATWWARDPLALRRARRRRGTRTGSGYTVVRLFAAIPRGVHEAIWALVLVAILGRNPLVAILAIGVPYGAITAKVVAETIDDHAASRVSALRAAGAGRLSALAYGVLPDIVGDVTSYGFYRLECSIRSSAVLGAIGAGGIGFQLALSFQSLEYRQIWTLLYALIALSIAADWWGASLRRRPSRLRRRVSLAVVSVLTMASLFWLRVRPASLIDSRARRLARQFVDESWPPRLPRGGFDALLGAAVDTVQLSVIGVSVATVIALPLSFVAARPRDSSRTAAWSLLVRGFLVVIRAIPPTVWALMMLFLVLPGPLPGGLALGIYTAGVIGRLGAEVVENGDRRPEDALRVAGSGRVCAVVYGLLPILSPRLVSLVMYRWEVAARETVIVGLVGAGGLGRILAQQSAAFDEGGMLVTIGALIAISWLIDSVSQRVRAAVR